MINLSPKSLIMKKLFLPEIWVIIYSYLEENREVYRKIKYLTKAKNQNGSCWLELCSNIIHKKHVSYRRFVKKYTTCTQKNARSAKLFIVNRKVKDIFPTLYIEFINKLIIVESIRHIRFEKWVLQKKKYSVLITFS